MSRLSNVLFLSLLTISTGLFCQTMSSSEIYHEIEKFKSPYRVLYIAAHPDDENTRLISYFTNELNTQTAYLSLTRGGGGQNLIGKEKGALLGVLRTEELLSARKIDGGEQYFTRAVDFGYSKTSDETFNFWGKEEMLSDVVYVMRSFKPHIVINRFPLNSYSGHGHHQASALLSEEAFDKSADSKQFPDQLRELNIWKPGTLYLNSSTWWDKNLVERAKNDFSISVVNIGAYNKMLGYSYNEMAAYSRSQHKSQGFGVAPSKGDKFEYLEFMKGNFEPGKLLREDLLDSIDKEWLNLGPLIDSILKKFNHQDPSGIVGDLFEIRDQALSLDKVHHRFDKKIKRLDRVIFNCLGFSLELIANKESFSRGETVTINIEAINRSSLPLNLQEINCDSLNFSWNRVLEHNIMFEDTFALTVDTNERYSNPYWLNGENEYRFNHDQSLLKRPENKPFGCQVKIGVEDWEISTESPVVYKWTDRVKGGLKKEVTILPEITVEFDKVIYMPKDSIIRGSIILTSHSHKDVEGYLAISHTPKMNFEYSGSSAIKSGESVYSTFKFRIDSSTARNHEIKVWFVTAGDTFHHQLFNINYDHIKSVNVLVPATARIVPVELKDSIGKIAYLAGPDNEMIDYLIEAGCRIETITEDDLSNGKLTKYDVLLFGIRSLNVHPSLDEYKEEIDDFMKNGGLVIVQYQTSRGINPIKISPYSFKISSNRVTDEKAVANWSKPDHAIYNRPFKLTRADFDGWNQERGLYFASDWSEDFTTVLSWHDPEELDSFGGIIIGDYGKGAFIYTGISFFRHIPYGVPGSYKLFFNILSYNSK